MAELDVVDEQPSGSGGGGVVPITNADDHLLNATEVDTAQVAVGNPPFLPTGSADGAIRFWVVAV